MARYSNTFQAVTMAAFNDTSPLTDSQYAGFLLGGSSTMMLKINEVYIGGESGASNPTTMVLARDSTVASGTLGGNMNAILDATSTAPGTVASYGNTAATTKPQRSSTLHLLQLSVNTYGGLVRWQARMGEEITVYGNTASLGEISLSAKAGTGVASGHIIYELV